MRVDKVGRGRVQYVPHCNREPGFFVLALEKVFTVSPDWHRQNRAGPLIFRYQRALDAILRRRPDLSDCAVHCRDCQIRFLTHPRNARRQDLRCPFGCRQHHRRNRSNESSRAWRSTPAGKEAKRQLNQRRSLANISAAEPPREQAQPLRVTTDKETTLATQQGAPVLHLELEGLSLDDNSIVNSALLPYVVMVVSLIEDRTVSCDELIAALRKNMRQHSIGRRSRRQYVLDYLNQHPP